MNTFDIAKERMDRFNASLDRLYYAGRIKLSELHAFRGILKDIDGMFKRLRYLSFFGIMHWNIKKDVNRLNSELTLMEYNVSLISTGVVCTL